MINYFIQLVIFYFIIIIVLSLVFKIIFPLKKKYTQYHKGRIINGVKHYYFKMEILLLIVSTGLIFITYKYGQIFFKFLQIWILYPSKSPLLIQVDIPFAYVTSVILSFILAYFLFFLSIIKIQRDFKDRTSRASSKYGYNVYNLHKSLNALFLILLVFFSIAMIWSFDEYLIANEKGIYYNPIENFGFTKEYRWSDVDKIVYVTATVGKDGNLYISDKPYYLLLMKDSKELSLLSENEAIVKSWIRTIKEKSGAEVYVKYGNELTKLENNIQI